MALGPGDAPFIPVDAIRTRPREKSDVPRTFVTLVTYGSGRVRYAMQLQLEQSGDVRIVRVQEAKLTYPVLSSFLAEMREIVEEGARKVVIDLEGVTYMDSASIGCLMDIHRLLKDCNGAVKLSGLRPRMETMLSMTGVHRAVELYREEAEALAAFGRPPAVAEKLDGR